MKVFALNALLAVALVASPSRAVASEEPPTFGSTDVAGALRGAEVAEIYILGRSSLFPGAPGPDTVRLLGCKYFLSRSSPAWAELEAAFAGVDIRLAPATTRPAELGVALILGDRAGIVWEMYAEDPFPTQTAVRGFSQRRRVEMSATFVRALEAFATRNRDYGVADGAPRVCH